MDDASTISFTIGRYFRNCTSKFITAITAGITQAVFLKYSTSGNKPFKISNPASVYGIGQENYFSIEWNIYFSPSQLRLHIPLMTALASVTQHNQLLVLPSVNRSYTSSTGSQSSILCIILPIVWTKD